MSSSARLEPPNAAETLHALRFGERGIGGPRSFAVNLTVIDSFGEGLWKRGCAALYRLIRDDDKWKSEWCKDSGISVAFTTVLRSHGAAFRHGHPADAKVDGRGRGEALPQFVGNLAAGMVAVTKDENGKFFGLDAAFDFRTNHGVILRDRKSTRLNSSH